MGSLSEPLEESGGSLEKRLGRVALGEVLSWDWDEHNRNSVPPAFLATHPSPAADAVCQATDGPGVHLCECYRHAPGFPTDTPCAPQLMATWLTGGGGMGRVRLYLS